MAELHARAGSRTWPRPRFCGWWSTTACFNTRRSQRRHSMCKGIPRSHRRRVTGDGVAAPIRQPGAPQPGREFVAHALAHGRIADDAAAGHVARPASNWGFNSTTPSVPGDTRACTEGSTLRNEINDRSATKKVDVGKFGRSRALVRSRRRDARVVAKRWWSCALPTSMARTDAAPCWSRQSVKPAGGGAKVEAGEDRSRRWRRHRARLRACSRRAKHNAPAR